MDTLGFLFPYGDFFTFSRAAVTPWFITLILVYFTVSLVYLHRRLAQFAERLQDHMQNLSVGRLKTDEYLEPFARKYERSFFPHDRGRRKTDLDAADVFDERSVLGKHLNLRYWTAVPGMLLGLGIFGTFLGLTLGIAGFDTTSAEAIQSSIRVLLAGMATAFLTSLWGMLCSMVFNVVEKQAFNRAAAQLDEFCHALDVGYQATKADLVRLEQEERERLLKQLLGSLTDEKADATPGEMLKKLLENAAKQTVALEMFSKVLADRIRVSTETLELRGRIKATIEETLRAGISQEELDNVLEDVARASAQRFEASDGVAGGTGAVDDRQSI